MTVHILGISCSLRNARFGAGSEDLVSALKAIKDENGLISYLEQQTKIRAEDFLEAGRQDNKPFDEIYRNLQKAKGDRGLSNSEAALSAALWGANQNGAEISHLGLSRHFPKSGQPQHLDELRERVLACDGLLLGGPVYFGDRSSIAQAFVEFLLTDDACAEHIRGRIYAGVSVGAKRNGGQETTLIYQMVDMTNMHMLAVGNDDKTTSQYGGTAKAGDVGTLYKDDYGITTSIGTGKRIAATAQMAEAGSNQILNDKVRLSVWLLQDNAEHHGRQAFEKLAADVEARVPEVKFHIQDFTEETIQRCIACDLCPIETGPMDEYRCIIKSREDVFCRHHKELIDTDAVLLGAYSPKDRHHIHSVYQQFIERTRYLRRDDYAFGERLAAPLVLSEIGSNQNLHIRMMTSLIRHQTIIHHPLIAMEHEGAVIEWEQLVQNGVRFAKAAIQLTAGRLALGQAHDKSYNPIGYEISLAKRQQDQAHGKFDAHREQRQKKHDRERNKRLR